MSFLLPASSGAAGLADSATTNGEQKTNFTNQRGFIAEMLGTDSASKATPRSLLGIDGATVTASVAANALTLALKTAAGADGASGASLPIPFRHATLTNGAVVVREATAAVGLVISSGSTLGHSSGVAANIYVYALDTGSAIELAVSSAFHGTSFIGSTTAEGGAGGADSATVIYSTTSRSNVAMRLVAILVSTQATAGTWAAVPTDIRRADLASVLDSLLTTKGDLLVKDANGRLQRLPVGTDNHLLTADSAQTLGVKWAASSAGDNASTLTNATFAISVAANAITIALKTKAGTDPSASDPVTVGFRHATLTGGTYVVRTITAALSLVVPSGATLGFSNSETNEIHIGFIDNAGTVELAVSQDLAEWTEGNVVSTTAIGTGSDSDTVLYSTSARTNVACRLAQVCTIQTGGTAGQWSNSPTVLRNVTNYGSAQLKNACQAWINFNGTGTVSIRDHFNVASLTDNGNGDYTVTFNVAQPDANYCVTGTAGEVTGGTNIPCFISPNYNAVGVAEVAPSTTAVRFNTISHGSVPVDCKYVYLAVTGRGK